MKWSKPNNSIGTIKKSRVFLLFPMTIDDETRWLEYVRIVYEWDFKDFDDREAKWIPLYFED